MVKEAANDPPRVRSRVALPAWPRAGSRLSGTAPGNEAGVMTRTGARHLWRWDGSQPARSLCWEPCFEASLSWQSKLVSTVNVLKTQKRTKSKVRKNEPPLEPVNAPVLPRWLAGGQGPWFVVLNLSLVNPQANDLPWECLVGYVWKCCREPFPFTFQTVFWNSSLVPSSRLKCSIPKGVPTNCPLLAPR